MMRALSFTQPFATLVGIGVKRIETRSWPPSSLAIGQWFAIHASKAFPVEYRELCYSETFSVPLIEVGYPKASELPFGGIVAVAYLHRVGRISRRNGVLQIEGRDRPLVDETEIAFGDYTPGRFAWCFSDVRRLTEPIACNGALGTWTVPSEIEARIRKEVKL